jgi:ubiquinone/menaquinone biosynthesis C-methylase UbiE
MTTTIEQEVVQHWTHGSLEEAIRSGLIASGHSLDRLQPDDLAPVDEFHMGGREATVHLAEKIDLKAGTTVLDIGSGIGGLARFLADRYGCRVVGIDVTPEYVKVAESLTGMVGLAGQVAFKVASATALPFDAESFDAALLIHVAMNIADKEKLCAEVARVLKTDGVSVLSSPVSGLGIAETVTTMSKGRRFLNREDNGPWVYGLAGHALS